MQPPFAVSGTLSGHSCDNDISLRPARPEDLPAILAIYNSAIRDTTAVYTEVPTTLTERAAWLKAKEAAGWPVIVATLRNTGSEHDRRVAGFGTYGPFRAWPGYRFSVEHSLYVSQAHRGHGVGSLLLQTLTDHATREKRHVMIAGIDAANSASIRLHEKHGFLKAGLMEQVGCKFGRWLDLQWMQKRLNTSLSPAEPAPAGLTESP
ncbi:GNAT family N-acetyltransferase [Oecophyllibacter saccharovorans]|uniref:GNAT family N-acetyltransferase n=1 Tax=Oecophyllibacter saccharovorans TaxID=2558360 RepID=UPI001F4F3E0B|nr:GNAT family N-acetyltransferase [Oecophyllibacter saccharovorans]